MAEFAYALIAEAKLFAETIPIFYPILKAMFTELILLLLITDGLKRLIITITRIAKKQTENYERFTEEKLDIVRMFNLLVECYFKTQHEVQFYANALNKSPKTLSNLFAIFNYPAPSKLIQKRIILEAKRHLQFTDQSAKEIAYTLGFTSPAHFSRFFKQHTGATISEFIEKKTVYFV